MDLIDRILFVELLGGIGDIVIALPAIQALKRSHPNAHLTVLTFAPGDELLHHHSCIDRVIVAAKGQARQTIDRLLANEFFDLIVSDTNYDGIAAAIDRIAAKCSVTNLWRSPPPDQFVSDRFLEILLTEGFIAIEQAHYQPQIYLTAAEQQAARTRLGAAYRPLIVLYSDAGMAIKRWSVSNWIALGRTLQQQFGATIGVPIGSNVEQAEQIVRAIGGTAQLWQRGSLRQLAAGMAIADLVIAADTGAVRIAAALNVPTITLFGPSWHGRYGQPAPHINLQGYPACPERIIQNFTEQHCWYDGVCPIADWHTCLADISVATVLEAARSLLTKVDTEPQTPISHPIPANSTTALEWRSVQNLLVMRLDNIGDVIMTSPALRALRTNLPEAKITLLASPGGALTAELLPWIDDVLSWRVLWQDLGRLDFDPDRERQLIQTLHDRQFDAAIIFTSFSQSPHPAALICALAGIPLRLGESKEQDIGTLTHAIAPTPDELHQAERNLCLIESVGFQVPDRSLTLQLKPQTSNLKLQNSYILLNPWTSCQSRNYDTDRFAVAAQQLSNITSWSVVVTGVEKDRDRSQTLFEQLGSCAIDAIGKTTLIELVELVANAKLVLTNNTSTMHIADATRTPNVVLFAGTELECQWRPRHSPSRLLRRPTVCNPCYAFTCPYDLQCLNILPETIVAAGLELLGKEYGNR